MVPNDTLRLSVNKSEDILGGGRWSTIKLSKLLATVLFVLEQNNFDDVVWGSYGNDRF
jgi:hypothetical protein